MESEQPHNKLVPTWQKTVWVIAKGLIVPMLCVCGLIVGLMIGYSLMGDRPVGEVFSIATWKHLIDLIFAT